MVVRTVAEGRNYPRSGWRWRTLLSIPETAYPLTSKLSDWYNILRRDHPKCPKWCSIGELLVHQDATPSSLRVGLRVGFRANCWEYNSESSRGTRHPTFREACLMLHRVLTRTPQGYITLTKASFLVMLARQSLHHPGLALPETAAGYSGVQSSSDHRPQFPHPLQRSDSLENSQIHLIICKSDATPLPGLSFPTCNKRTQMHSGPIKGDPGPVSPSATRPSLFGLHGTFGSLQS